MLSTWPGSQEVPRKYQPGEPSRPAPCEGGTGGQEQQCRGHEADLIPSYRKPSPHGQQIMLIDVESRTLSLEAPSEAMQLAFPWVQCG